MPGTTQRELAAFCCRIIALFLFAQAAVTILAGLIYLFWFVVYATSYGFRFPHQARTLVPLASPVIAMVFAAAVLWLRADDVAKRLPGDAERRLILNRISAEDWFPVVLAIVGVSLFVEGVSGVARIVAIQMLADNSAFDALRSPDFWSALVTIVISVWLVLGSRGVAGGIARLRSRNSASPESADVLDNDIP